MVLVVIGDNMSDETKPKITDGDYNPPEDEDIIISVKPLDWERRELEIQVYINVITINSDDALELIEVAKTAQSSERGIDTEKQLEIINRLCDFIGVEKLIW